MTEWQKSSLQIGDEVKVPTEFFETRELGQKRLLLSRYIGETKHGLLLEFIFTPAFDTEIENYSFRRFVDWELIYCGRVKLHKRDGQEIKAVMKGATT